MMKRDPDSKHPTYFGRNLALTRIHWRRLNRMAHEKEYGLHGTLPSVNEEESAEGRRYTRCIELRNYSLRDSSEKSVALRGLTK